MEQLFHLLHEKTRGGSSRLKSYGAFMPRALYGLY